MLTKYEYTKVCEVLKHADVAFYVPLGGRVHLIQRKTWLLTWHAARGVRGNAMTRGTSKFNVDTTFHQVWTHLGLFLYTLWGILYLLLL